VSFSLTLCELTIDLNEMMWKNTKHIWTGNVAQVVENGDEQA
jgi:hypothetical protein